MHGYSGIEDEKTDPGVLVGVEAIGALVDLVRPLDPAGTDLLRRAAHELRTPLTSVFGFVELLADHAAGPVTEEQDRILRTVSRNVRRLMELVDAFEPVCAGPVRDRERL